MLVSRRVRQLFLKKWGNDFFRFRWVQKKDTTRQIESGLGGFFLQWLDGFGSFKMCFLDENSLHPPSLIYSSGHQTTHFGGIKRYKFVAILKAFP